MTELWASQDQRGNRKKLERMSGKEGSGEGENRAGQQGKWNPEKEKRRILEQNEKDPWEPRTQEEKDKIMLDILYNIYLKHPQLMTR